MAINDQKIIQSKLKNICSGLLEIKPNISGVEWRMAYGITSRAYQEWKAIHLLIRNNMVDQGFSLSRTLLEYSITVYEKDLKKIAQKLKVRLTIESNNSLKSNKEVFDNKVNVPEKWQREVELELKNLKPNQIGDKSYFSDKLENIIGGSGVVFDSKNKVAEKTIKDILIYMYEQSCLSLHISATSVASQFRNWSQNDIDVNITSLSGYVNILLYLLLCKITDELIDLEIVEPNQAKNITDELKKIGKIYEKISILS